MLKIGDVVTRYKLWEDDLFVLNNVELYDKHLIKKNFVLEIWTFNGEINSSQATAIDLWSSIRTVPSDFTVDTSIPLAYSALATYVDLANTNQIAYPATPPSAPHYWYDLHLGVTQVANLISRIANQGSAGAACDLVQAVGADQPLYVAAGNALVPSPLFRVQDNTDNLVNADLTSAANSVLTIGFVYRQNASGTDNIFVQSGGGTFFGTLVQVANGNLSWTAGGVAVGTSVQLAIDTDYIVILKHDTTVNPRTIDIYVYAMDGTLIVHNNNTHNNLVVGGGTLTLGVALFDMYEFLHIKSALSLADINLLVSYFVGKYAPQIALPLTFNANSNWLDNV